MKRAKNLFAILSAATITLGSVVSVSADQSFQIKGIAKPSTNYAIEEKAEATTTTTSSLKYTEKIYFDETSIAYGKYPSITGSSYDKLNEKIKNDIFQDFRLVKQSGTPFFPNLSSVSFTVTDEGTISVIAVTVKVNNSASFYYAKDFVHTYYVDRSTSKEMTETEYNAAVEAAKATEEATTEEEATDEEAIAKEPTMVPLRTYLTKLGYELKWNPEIEAVEIIKGDFKTTIVTDKNAYQKDGENIELEEAPTLVDGSLFVPASFFSEILGAKVQVDAEGNVEITEK